MSMQVGPVLRTVTVTAVVLAVLGCGRGEEAAAPAAAAADQPRQAQPPASGAPADATADMVRAVSSGSGTGPVDVKFSLARRPEVDTPLKIDLAVIPSDPLTALTVTVSAAEGLELVGDGNLPRIENPQPGVAVLQSVTVVPRREGISYVSATVLADSETSSLARTFNIPVIATPRAGTAPATGAAADRPAAEPAAGGPS